LRIVADDIGVRSLRQKFLPLGAGFAFAAILLHLVLSFAHVHPPQPVSSRLALVAAPQSPVDGAAEDDCSICANMAAFATLDLPSSGQPDVLRFWAARLMPWPSFWDIRPAGYRFFHTRAPPSPSSPEPFLSLNLFWTESY
jgi:hypothetical protein